jgi:hypothetical protein
MKSQSLLIALQELQKKKKKNMVPVKKNIDFYTNSKRNGNCFYCKIRLIIIA